MGCPRSAHALRTPENAQLRRIRLRRPQSLFRVAGREPSAQACTLLRMLTSIPGFIAIWFAVDLCVVLLLGLVRSSDEPRSSLSRDSGSCRRASDDTTSEKFLSVGSRSSRYRRSHFIAALSNISGCFSAYRWTNQRASSAKWTSAFRELLLRRPRGCTGRARGSRASATRVKTTELSSSNAWLLRAETAL